MPRPNRNIVPGYPYHLVQRGNNKQITFQSEDDARIYLYWFEEARRKEGMRVLAYCLMNNHVHFVAIADHAMAFAAVIRIVHTRYANYFNHKYGHLGHLWHGRYFSVLLNQDHLIAAVRYVERNPVRAGLVHQPSDWVWSSAKAHLKIERSIISLEETSSFFDCPSWKEYICEADRQEDIERFEAHPKRGRPNKKGV